MANLATVAAAVVDEINTASAAGTFNRTFAAKTLWAKRQIKLEETDVLRVDVAPINQTRILFARGVHLLEFRYHVGVRKRFVESDQDNGGEISDDEVGGLTTLLDGLLEFFMPRQTGESGRPLTTFPTAWVLGPTGDMGIESTILWEDLETMRQFTGFFPLTIRVAESDAG